MNRWPTAHAPHTLQAVVARLCMMLLLAVSQMLAAAGVLGVSPADDVSAQALNAASGSAKTLEVFVRDGCPHCADAKAWLPEFERRHPEIRVELRWVDREPGAGDELVRRFEQAGLWPPGVPTFVFENRMVVGFGDPEQSAPEIERLVASAARSGDTIHTPLLGALRLQDLGLPAFTFALGLVDGLNPCATWVLLFLLSLLVHLRDRARMAMIAGTFVLASGLVYYALMAAWLNAFALIGVSDAVRILLGVIALAIGGLNVREFTREGTGFTLAIPDAAKPGLYARMRAVVQAPTLAVALTASATLAIAVNFVELLCTAGFPAMYTAILAQQPLDAWARYAYLGLYNLAYVADDALLVGTAVWALGSRRLTERAGRWLKLVSGAAMLLLGAVMLLRPQWLSGIG